MYFYFEEVDIDAEGNSEEDEEDEEGDDVQEVKRELETSHIDLVTPEPTPVKASGVVDLTASATKPTARIKLEPESPMVRILVLIYFVFKMQFV